MRDFTRFQETRDTRLTPPLVYTQTGYILFFERI